MIEVRRQEPWSYFLGSSIEHKYKKEWRGDFLKLQGPFPLETWTLLQNYWRFGINSKIKQPAYNDEDIFRDDRSRIEYSTERFLLNSIWIKSDRRKKHACGFVGGLGNAKLRGRGYFIEFEIDYKPH